MSPRRTAQADVSQSSGRRFRPDRSSEPNPPLRVYIRTLMNALSIRCVALAVTGMAASVVPALAQTVQGQLIDSNRDTPVAYAFIILADSTGSEIVRVLADANGAFLIDAPAAGRYRLRTAIIGRRSWTSPAFVLDEGQTFDYRMEVPLQAVHLDALVVEGARECQVDPDSGRAVSIVWEEAKKALAAVKWTRDSALLSFQAIEFNRDLHPETLRSLGGRANRQSGIATGSPFTSATAQELSKQGYVRAVGDENAWKPYGPDADVLLSEAFADDHCFALQPHPDDEDLIGLAFQPVQNRDVPDIRGVMWLDRPSAMLRRLEFRYDRLPWPVALRHAGGDVRFEQLPNGLWFVSQWRLRLPRLSRQTRGLDLGQYRVQSYSETGGYVIQLRRPDGTPLTRDLAAKPVGGPGDVTPGTGARARAMAGGVAGAVTDVATGSTLPGAAVLLLDSAETIRAVGVSDSLGRFFARAERAGAFTLTVRRIGYRPTGSSQIDVPEGLVVRTRINLGASTPEDAERDPASFRSFGDVIPQFRFTRDDIARTEAATVFDLALTIVGTRAVGSLETPTLVLNDTQCAPTVYVDGHPSATSHILHVLIEGWVRLVEISPRPADTPREFRHPDPAAARCGAILIWSATS